MLGEYIWFSKDGLPDQGQNQKVIAASYYLSPNTRSINFYKIKADDSSLYLWQRNVLSTSIEVLSTLKFESGVFMYIENSKVKVLKICTENQFYSSGKCH